MAKRKKNTFKVGRISFFTFLLFFVALPICLFKFGGNLFLGLKEKPVVKSYTKNYSPTSIPTPTTAIIYPTRIPERDPDKPWGVAWQIGEKTWTMKVGQDERMATPQEILDALNVYRERNGVGRLGWNDRLAAYAQSRTDYFNSIGTTDAHAGFQKFLNEEDGFEKLGFAYLGENSSYGYRLLGVHLIEWVYAGDEPHDKNQLSPNWNSVGVGVTGTATDLIFGADQFK